MSISNNKCEYLNSVFDTLWSTLTQKMSYTQCKLKKCQYLLFYCRSGHYSQRYGNVYTGQLYRGHCLGDGLCYPGVQFPFLGSLIKLPFLGVSANTLLSAHLAESDSDKVVSNTCQFNKSKSGGA